jgi:hypothetical protein
MSFLKFFRKKQDEASRIARLVQTGRIADGEIIDVKLDAQNRVTLVFYSYLIAGVQYESSQELTEAQRTRAELYAPGTIITIRYDPRQPGNSIVV